MLPRPNGVVTLLTDYGLREGAHVDPDNNLLRFGADAAD